MKLPSSVRLVGAGVLVFGIAWSTSAFLRRMIVPPPASAVASSAPRTRPPGESHELVLIYFGSAHCAWAKRPELPRVVDSAKRQLARYAASRGLSFTTIGVALDWSPKEGLEHLAQIGEFDEVSAGSSWSNSIALKFFGKAVFGPASTPEIIILERSIGYPNPATGVFNNETTSERFVARYAGMVELRRWTANGAHLPDIVARDAPDSPKSNPLEVSPSR